MSYMSFISYQLLHEEKSTTKLNATDGCYHAVVHYMS